jgi:hypothetical protein
MEVSAIAQYSAHCEERLYTYHRKGAYENISKLEEVFTDEDRQLAQKISDFVRGLSVVAFDSNCKSLKVDVGVEGSLHSHFLSVYMPVKIRADGNCLYHSISTGLVGDDRLSSILRFGCLGVLLQHKDYFTSHLVNERKIFFWDDIEGKVVLGTLIDIAFLLGTLSKMVLNRDVIPIPEKLRNIPINTLCYGRPSQILALSILTNRVINVYEPDPSEDLAENISEIDFKSFLNNKKTNRSYEWERRSVQKDPLSIYLQHNHFSLLMPIGQSHFTINYHFITPKDCKFIKDKIPDDMIMLDDEPEIIDLESSGDDECAVMDVDLCFEPSISRSVDISLRSPGDSTCSTSVHPSCKDFSIVISPQEKAIADLALNTLNEESMDDHYVSSLLFS